MTKQKAKELIYRNGWSRYKENGCIEWNGECNGSEGGYGRVRYNGKKYRVHRLAAFIHLEFELDSSLVIMHTCDNPKCFNIEHLRVGTQKDNVQDYHKKKGAPKS